MRTNSKKEEVKESDLKELCTLWEHTAESNIVYLSGMLNEELKFEKVIAFYNQNKKNENEPDIRVFSLDENKKTNLNIISLWKEVSKDKVDYFTGTTNDNERVVAFINKSKEEKQPLIKIYLKK